MDFQFSITNDHQVPIPGQMALVRQRRYLVEAIVQPSDESEATLVDLSCIDDDAQGQALSVLWEHELGAQVSEDAGWSAVGEKPLDDPELFAAYLRTLSWNCVTATDPDLFQSPFRAGIRTDAYQLEPLYKALRLPRVNLFIADDVGLGKTIEAGLIARELLLRRRIDRIVVACPPSMLEQWRDEMESRFGLVFVILDRDYLMRMRRERGFSVNPWTTHSRFLISQRLLIDEVYASGLRDWMGRFCPRSLLILDEAHNVAPSSGSRYAIDSQATRAIRDLAPRFEHRLFLSATPHNGHSNSFSALLEILDPQRFCRGVRVLKDQLDDIMVRRLKSDIRELEGGFPKRTIVQIDIDGLSPDAPELILASKLDSYRRQRDVRLSHETRLRQIAAGLVIGCLQKRLLSSIDAFARTLAVHRRGVERALRESSALHVGPSMVSDLQLLNQSIDIDLTTLSDPEVDNTPQLDDDDIQETEQIHPAEVELDVLLELATEASVDASDVGKREALELELAFVDEMAAVAETARYNHDPRVRKLIEWIDHNMCPSVRHKSSDSAIWNDRKVIIFTEYEDTRRYLERCLAEAIAGTERASERIATFTGSTSRNKREDIKEAFNKEPGDHPLRILIATDAAREGLNLQRHCHDLFHFDLPWNPGRLDQRNGRIDRKLQPSDEVFCHYFVFTQRPEDRVLEVLVKKAETIREELGSVAKVLEGRIADRISREGLRRDQIDDLAASILNEGPGERQSVIEEELEDARSRQQKLMMDVDQLRTRLERSRRHIGITSRQLQQTLSMSLRLAGAPSLTEIDPGETPEPEVPRTFRFPADSQALVKDSGWTGALDTLRHRKQRGESLGEWRRRSPARPVVFEDAGRLGDNAVHLHLEHRVAQRLLSRFTAQGLIHHDLSKACLTASPDSIPRIVLLGRLSVYGPRAARLHEEIVPVTARWTEPSQRTSPLIPYSRTAEQETLSSLQRALDEAGQSPISNQVQARVAASAQQDIADLLPHLEIRAADLLKRATSLLSLRGESESEGMRELLESQKGRIQEALGTEGLQLTLGFNEDEIRQYQADRRAWERRLEEIERELIEEPRRIFESYTTQAHRMDPIGVVYLWPRTG